MTRAERSLEHLGRIDTRELTPQPQSYPTLRPFAIDDPNDQPPYWVCAPDLARAQNYVRLRRLVKGIGGDAPPIVPIPMRPI